MNNSEYTAVLLAAGYGSRISDMTNKPKCLLELENKTLFERNLQIWKELGIKKVNLVLGYEKEQIVEVAKNYSNDFEFNFLLNEDYKKQGNTFSLYLGIKDITGPCLIFDADLIYEKSILEEFLLDSEGSQILVGEGDLNDIESAKTLIDAEGFARMTIDKRAVSPAELEKFSFAGEAIGILKFSSEQTQLLSKKAGQFLSKNENILLNWEHLLNQYLPENNVGTHLFKTGRWVEIDTPEDFEAAKKLFEK